MITEKMIQKFKEKIYHTNVNVSLTRKCNSNQKWNNDKCRCECKKHHIYEKNYIWNRASCHCESGKYLASIIDDNSVITCGEIIEKTKTIPKFLYFTCIFIDYYRIIDNC